MQNGGAATVPTLTTDSRRFRLLFFALLALTLLPLLVPWRLAARYRAIPRVTTFAESGGFVNRVDSGALAALASGTVRDLAICGNGTAAAGPEGVLLYREGIEVRIAVKGDATAVDCTNGELIAVGFADGAVEVLEGPNRRRIAAAGRPVRGVAMGHDRIYIALGRTNALIALDREARQLSTRRLTGRAGPLKLAADGRLFMSDVDTGRIWELTEGSERLVIIAPPDERIAPRARLLEVDGHRLHVAAEGVTMSLRLPEPARE